MNRKVIRVPVTPEAADGIVFWTKNFRPFMKHIHRAELRGLPFYVQYTINGYPQSLENHVVDWRKSAETAKSLTEEFGQRVIVWRYDTIILSDLTPHGFHVDNFRRIADSLAGSTDEVVVSFLQLYAKTKRNMDRMAAETLNQWLDPSIEEKRALAAELWEIAKCREMNLTICSQPELITSQQPSRCIDAKRLADIGGKAFAAKTLGNRPGCECAASRDIGDYDTCPHGCVYCYAVRNQATAIQRFRSHDPTSPFLFTEPGESKEPPPAQQERLFE